MFCQKIKRNPFNTIEKYTPIKERPILILKYINLKKFKHCDCNNQNCIFLNSFNQFFILNSKHIISLIVLLEI